MYRQFNIQQFYVLPTQCIYVFCVDLRTNSDYFNVSDFTFFRASPCMKDKRDCLGATYASQSPIGN